MRRVLVSLLTLACLSCGKKPGPIGPPGLFTEHPSNPLRTRDEGNYNQVAVQLLGGDKDNFHIVGLISDPFVMHDGGRYRMWFTGLQQRDGEDVQGVSYSESEDGALWEAARIRKRTSA